MKCSMCGTPKEQANGVTVCGHCDRIKPGDAGNCPLCRSQKLRMYLGIGPTAFR